MYKRILVPIDGSELAEQILPHVKTFTRGNGAEIVLLRVIQTPVSAYTLAEAVLTAPVVSREVTLPAIDQVRERAEGYLQRVGFQLEAEGYKVKTEVVGGAVADTILEYANAIGADLIALSTHGRGGVSRVVLGSVADEIVRGVHIPVLLVRPNEK